MKTKSFHSSFRSGGAASKCLRAVAGITLLTVTLAAQASVKWDQPPDPANPTNVFYGWNQLSIANQIIAADDYICTNATPVVGIRWWGSYIGWNKSDLPTVRPDAFLINFWSDVPGGVNTPSHPGSLAHGFICSNFTFQCVGVDYDPRTGTFENCYLFEQTLIPEEYFNQPPGSHVLWISIAAIYNNFPTIQYPWGWKTRPRTNSPAPDAAVIFQPGNQNFGLPITWPGNWPNDQWDLAFELITTAQVAGLSKWEQVPDLSTDAMDVNASGILNVTTNLLADDFVCTQTGPITNITIWGSWLNNLYPNNGSTNVIFTLSIHTNTPGGPGGPVYVRSFNPAQFRHSVLASGVQKGWLNAPTNYAFPGDTECHQFEFPITNGQIFVQQGTPGAPITYWLDVQAQPVGSTSARFGWNTTLSHTNGFSRWVPGRESFIGSWTNLFYPPTHINVSKRGQPVDMAFRINTGVATGGNVIKWSQPPCIATNPGNWYNGWDQPSIYGYATIVADDWLCTNAQPVSDIHWWGSYVGWANSNQPPQLPIAFDVAIWSDVPPNTFFPPTGTTTTFSHPGVVLWHQQIANYSSRFVGWDIDPLTSCPNSEATFRYDYNLPSDQWFTQPSGSNVFWISIAAVYPDPLSVTNQWGWKTRPRNPSSTAPDEAVVMQPTTPVVNGVYQFGSPVGVLDPLNRHWDMAFQLTSSGGGTEQLDFGDAPDAAAAPIYPTLLANNGARHTILPGFFLGTAIDAEADGQPNIPATGDDIAGADDEDGVTFTSPLIPGSNATVQVVASAPGFLNAWVDFGRDGSWAQPGDKIFTGFPLAAGVNNLTFPVPPGAVGNTNTYARFRLTSPAVFSIGYDGPAPDGEVEDYQVQIQPTPTSNNNLDFGDAPDGFALPIYPTLLANNGARHTIVAGMFLGTTIDAEADGQPNITATGDDIAGVDDEDGVIFTSPLAPSFSATVQVTASAAGILNAWLDFGRDGSWAQPGDQIFVNLALAPGINNLTFLVPSGAVGNTNTYARFRFSSLAGLSYDGPAPDGEVEDYQVQVQQGPLQGGMDFGDAPDAIGAVLYPTLLANNGARHFAFTNFCLGPNIDVEPNGQPNVAATGDDIAGVPDDEDGVAFTTAIQRGGVACASVFLNSAYGTGSLDAWVDFDRDGVWSAGEQIFTSQILSPGLNAGLCFAVPGAASVGDTYARFRLSSAGGLSPTGLAPNGEVEDYKVTICQPLPATNVVITSITATNLNANLVLTFKWNAQSNITYQLQRAMTLSNTPPVAWSNAGPAILGTTNVLVITNSPAFQSYFRFWVPFVCP